MELTVAAAAAGSRVLLELAVECWLLAEACFCKDGHLLSLALQGAGSSTSHIVQGKMPESA